MLTRDYQHDSLPSIALGLSVPKLILDQKYKDKVWLHTSLELLFSIDIHDDLLNYPCIFFKQSTQLIRKVMQLKLHTNDLYNHHIIG